MIQDDLDFEKAAGKKFRESLIIDDGSREPPSNAVHLVTEENVNDNDSLKNRRKYGSKEAHRLSKKRRTSSITK